MRVLSDAYLWIPLIAPTTQVLGDRYIKQTGEKMILILDTNIFCADYRLSGAHFRIFLDGFRMIPANLKIPEVVVDEVVNRFREGLRDAVGNIRKSERLASSMMGRAIIPSESQIAVESESATFRKWFVEELESVSAEILSYPTVSHKTVVQRDLSRRKPFSESGAGYRDCLIWENIRQLVVIGNEPAVFVTNNTRDFGVGPSIHSDLEKDLWDPWRIELINSLSEFNSKFIIPRLRMLENVDSCLKQQGANGFDLRGWLNHGFTELLLREEFDHFGGPENENYSASASRILTLHNVTVGEAHELDSGERLLRLYVDVDVEISVHYRRRWLATDESEDWEEVRPVTVTCDLILSSDGIELVADDIISVNLSTGTFDPRKGRMSQ